MNKWKKKKKIVLWRLEKMRCPSSVSEAEIETEFFFPSAFWSVQALNRLDDTHSHGGEWTTESTGLNNRYI